MMPLFFIAGGFTAIGSWRRARAHGIRPAAWVSARLIRLFAPFVVVMLTIAAALLALSIAGVPAEIVQVAGWRVSQPMWFLGVFALSQALVPALAGWHERAPFSALGALCASVLLVDGVRFATSITAVGYVNLAFAWILIQHLGFWAADGRVDALRIRSRALLVQACLAAAVILVVVGPYPANMYANQDPPTLALVLLGAAQLGLFSLAKPWLRRVGERRSVGAIVDWIGARAMTVYLWHMPVLLALAGLCVLLSFAGALSLPPLHSGAWWLTRPVWLAVVVVSVAVVARAAARFERRPASLPCEQVGRVALATVAGVASVVLLFVAGLGWPTAILSAALASAAVLLAKDGSGVGGLRTPSHSVG
jgi:peptidoglycan/LPS O-acetylase OafA/YrhL